MQEMRENWRVDKKIWSSLLQAVLQERSEEDWIQKIFLVIILRNKILEGYKERVTNLSYQILSQQTCQHLSAS